MGESNLELVQQVLSEATGGGGIDALNDATTEAIFEHFDPEIEFHEDPRFPEAATYRGIDAVRAYWEHFGDSFRTFCFQPERVITLDDDRVAVFFTLVTEGKDSGAKVMARPAWIFTIRRRRVRRIEVFLDPGRAITGGRPESPTAP